jgi:type IV pilus assembly protein PilE
MNRHLAMTQTKQKDGDSAFTLVETMIVVAIIGVLAAVAMLSYAHFTKKSQSVEADIAVAEVARLEEVYFSSTGTYSSDLDAIGFKANPPLQYYRVSVQAVNGPDGSMFQVTANPLSGADASQARSVTRYTSNQADEKNSGGGGGSGGSGKTSTVTSVGNTGSGQSVGGGEKDELSEQMGRTVDQTNQSGKIVDSGKPNSLGTVNK